MNLENIRTPGFLIHSPFFSNVLLSMCMLNIPLLSQLPPRINKSPTPVSKLPVNKMTDKPPRPELVMGIPNLSGPSKPPMLTPAHNSIFQHSSLQHIIRTGPPPLSSPKIAVTTKSNPAPQSTISPSPVLNVSTTFTSTFLMVIL